MKKILLVLFIISLSSQAMACGAKRYSGPNQEQNYVVHLLYNYYVSRAGSANACTIAKKMAPIAGTWLAVNVPNNTLADTSKLIYNKLYIGSYMKDLRSLLIGGTTIRGGTQIWRTIQAEKKKRTSIFNFQQSVIAPYGYNVAEDRSWVNNTKRYYSNGKVKAGCGYLVCN